MKGWDTIMQSILSIYESYYMILLFNFFPGVIFWLRFKSKNSHLVNITIVSIIFFNFYFTGFKEFRKLQCVSKVQLCCCFFYVKRSRKIWFLISVQISLPLDFFNTTVKRKSFNKRSCNFIVRFAWCILVIQFLFIYVLILHMFPSTSI